MQMNDLPGGVLLSIFSSPSDALQHIQNGMLRALSNAWMPCRRFRRLPSQVALQQINRSI